MSENSPGPVLSSDKEHSPYGCSSHSSYAICPGYKGGQSSNPAADLGNDLHDIAAEALEAVLAGESEPMLACIGDELPCGQIFEREHADKVSAYVEHCMTLLSEYPQCDIVKVEQPQSMSSLGLPDDETTPDFLAIEPFGMCIVADLKTGANQVGADSEQLRSYGLEAFIEYGCTSLLCCVSQGGFLKRKLYTEQEMLLYQEFMTNMLAMAQWESPPLIPGKACTFCIRDCAVRDGSMGESAGSMMSVNVEELSPEKVAHFLQYTEILEGAIKQLGKIKARAHAFTESGVEVKGWHLEDGDRSYVWKSEKDAEGPILELFKENEVREKIDPVPEKGPKTRKVKKPIPASELYEPRKMKSSSAVKKLVGQSKPVMKVLSPLILTLPPKTKRLVRDKKKLETK